MRDRWRFLLPIVWMGAIALLSSDLFSTNETGAWLVPLLAALFPGAGPDLLRGFHAALRKLGHLVEYGVLAALWLEALRPGRTPRRAAFWAVALAAGYAVVDEARQGLTAHRSPATLDVTIDTVGALLAVAWLEAPGGLAITVARLLRWAALGLAAGSLAAAALDWHLDLPAWDLVGAAAAAALLAWGVRRIERRWQAQAAASAAPRAEGGSAR